MSIRTAFPLHLAIALIVLYVGGCHRISAVPEPIGESPPPVGSSSVGGSSDVVAIKHNRSTAVDLLNALLISLGSVGESSDVVAITLKRSTAIDLLNALTTNLGSVGAPAPPAPEPAPAPPDATQQQRQAAIPPFPWPPGPASAQSEIPSKWLTSSDGHTTLSNVGGKLEEALRAAKYRKWSYSSVPNGFALVTQLEQIKPDGYPKADPERWSADLPSLSDLSLWAFVKALAVAPAGNYRVIVFIVTNADLKQTGEKPTEDQAQRWLVAGVNTAPSGTLTYGKDFKTTALIYEFRKRQKTDATFVPTSETRPEDHLFKAGILVPLSWSP